mmetsp:Transcript_5715/g.18414  ORF Transcript_5715/g.18414 Transcript_5715/m.18414 type:complete len:84 (-) Transcript_5715:2962-3213(-)
MLVKSIKCVFSMPSKCCLLYALLLLLCNLRQVISSSKLGNHTPKDADSSSLISKFLFVEILVPKTTRLQRTIEGGERRIEEGD